MNNDRLSDQEREEILVRLPQIFHPTRPVFLSDLFVGRHTEKHKVMRILRERSSHTAVHGPRGVGKTSLAKIAAVDLGSTEPIPDPFPLLIVTDCDSRTTFASLCDSILDDLEIKSEIEPGALHQKFSKDISPAQMARVLRGKCAVIIIDEFEIVSDKETRQLIAELMRILANDEQTADISIVVVGIAENVSDLFAGHRSLDRCLQPVPLEKMSDVAIREILTVGAEKLGITFSDDVLVAIQQTSSGYPYYAHLLGRHCSEKALLENSRIVSMPNYHEGLSSAVDQVDRSLRDQYEKATRSNSSVLSTFLRTLVQIAASFPEEGFTRSELLANLKRREILHEIAEITERTFIPKEVEQTFARCLEKLSGGSNGHVTFTRVIKGRYRFTNSLMPCYVRMRIAQRRRPGGA